MIKGILHILIIKYTQCSDFLNILQENKHVLEFINIFVCKMKSVEKINVLQKSFQKKDV